MKKHKISLKMFSFLLVFVFLFGMMDTPALAATTLSSAIKNAYKDTLDLMTNWGDITDICSNSVDTEEVFEDYYEALDAYDTDPDNAYYGSVYVEPRKKSKQKTTYRLGTPIDIHEYTIIGFLNDDNQRDVKINECTGTMWFRKISGEYIITKVKRNISPVDDIEDIDDEDTIDLLSEQIDDFLGDDSDLDDQEDEEAETVKISVTKCPTSSYSNTVTISGKVSESGDSYAKVAINGESVKVDSYDGTWSKKVTLKEGNNTFTITAQNSKGVTDTVTKNITFICQGPDLIIDRCPDTSSLSSVKISGSVSDKNDKSPEVYINGELVDVYYGSWSSMVTLKDGQNSFEIKAVNSLGKSTVINKTIVFSTEGPKLVVITCPSTSSTKTVTISGQVSDDNDNSPKVYINDELVSISYGSWSKQVSLKEGDNTFTIKAVNNLGKTTTITKTINFGVGTPDLTITTCPDTSTVSKVTISGQVSDKNDSNPKVYVNDDLVSVYYGSWSKQVSLKEGDNTFTIKAVNNLGKATTVTKTITFSVASPDLILNNCPDTSSVSKITLTGQVSDANDSNPKVYINDDQLALSWDKSWSKEITLKEGSNTFTFKATNSMGKSTVITKTIIFVIDPPSVMITNCPDTSTTNQITITGKVSDNNDKAPKMYFNGQQISINWDNCWSKTVTLSEGQNTFEIKATNSFGKTTTITKTVTYGFTPPTIQVLVCPDTSTSEKITISGTVSDVVDSNPLVYVNNETISVSGGTWSKEVSLTAGVNTFTIKATNSGGKSTTVTKTVTYNPETPAQ